MTKQFSASFFLFSISIGYGNAGEDNLTENTEQSTLLNVTENSEIERLYKSIQRTGTPVQLITPEEIQANVTTSGNVYSKQGAPEKTLSPYFYVPSESASVESFPLKKTEVEVDVTGVIADVNIRQVYQNNGKDAIEAIYTFPMSTRAAVHDMQLTIGKRIIQAEVQTKKEARETYENAKKSGKSASLLEQKRPNVFQMNVANILPGDEIVVDLQYTELLVPVEQTYEFVFPTVVGPRFSNTLASNATEDESWIENPYLRQGDSGRATVDIDINIQAPFPVRLVKSPSHDVDIDYVNEKKVDIGLSNAPQNRDFVLQYRLAGEQISSGLMTYEGDEENFFMAMIEPPAKPTTEDVLPREYIFIVDISGSMSGFPLDISKGILNEMLENLREEDYFNVLLFAGGSLVLSPNQSIPVTEENIQLVQKWLSNLHGGGSTQLLLAMKTALQLPQREGVSRTMAVITDGYVSVERKAFDLIKNNLGDSNLFAYGIGSGVNRHLIEGMARTGKGEAFIVSSKTDAYEQGARFANYILNPVLTDIEFDFDGIEVYDVSPVEQPDVFAARPIVVYGKYKGKAKGSLTISGVRSDGEYQQTLSFTDASGGEENDALALLWARNKIAEFDDYKGLFNDTRGEQEVIQLGLQYNLMTQYTSFIAVDKIKRANGKYKVIKQPLEMPKNVSETFASTSSGYGAKSVKRSRGSRSARAKSSKSSQIVLGSYGRVKYPYSSSDSIVTGSLNESLINKLVKRKLSPIRYCYQREAAKIPSLGGKITFKFVIEKDGVVSQVSVKKTTMPAEGGTAVSACIKKQLKTLKFPTGNSITIVSYPFSFSPK